MSSDESTSTQISAISSQGGGVQKKAKPHKAEQWEIDLIGKFLLSLYHRSLISSQNNWICAKNEIRKEFEQFTKPDIRQRLKDLNGTDNIGTLLHRCGFLWNTPRGSPSYKLKCKEVLDFRNKELKLKDKRQLNGDICGSVSANDNENEPTAASLALFKVDDFEIDEDYPEHELAYQGTTMQQRRNNYHPTNMSCCICQQDFSTMDSYEEHIQKHNDESDFKYTNELSQFDSPIFKMSYRLCKNSHYFCFNFETDNNNLVIENIIIVQSRTLYYVRKKRVPYDMPTVGCDKFFVDSHLFTMFVEQPIIMIAYIKDSKETRIIEEHHFMRSLEFPKVHIATKPFLLPSKKHFKPLCKLPEYFPPIEIRDALRDDFVYEKLMKTSNEFRDYIRNDKILQPQTIGPTLGTLLHIEDMDTIKEYLHLLQHNVTLRSFGDDYSLKLRPKQRLFIENILSTFDDVIITTRTDITADSEKLIEMILTPQEDLTKKGMHVGRIEYVNSGRVSFKCYKKLDTKRKYTILFRPSRLTLRYQYRAMELLPIVMPYLRKFLFPGQLVPKPLPSMGLDLYNQKIYTNPEQLQTVRNIAEGPRNDATFIIFGPPGTGKTETLVESILQVLKRNDTKILVTASSNSACDEIALRLCHRITPLDIPRAIVRIYAKSNEARLDNIDDVLLEHSNMYNGHFLPDVEVLHEYRIVVCTMSVVAKLATGKFGRRENSGTMYTHLFIDEVAASSEVETLIPITSVLTPKSCLIIAGDYKQLGPVIKSKRAEELRLGVSLMDRLLQRDCYRVNTDTGDYDRSIQSRLRRNYRSHPAIVNLYSAMYYNHDLEANVEIDDDSLFKHWHRSPSKDYPIIFHSVNGTSRSDSQSYSLYNSLEIDIVMDYVKDLMFYGINGKPVRETDIGIISPYKKQYLRIREELNLRKWYAIETGSVEMFQGKEKEIIIASFVRSGTATLGFLDSPRRLNVTISRAKSLLVLIGNARTLSMNPDFDHIVKECQRHKTFIGKLENEATTTTSEDQANNISQRANGLLINDDNDLDTINKSLKDLKLKNKNQNVTNDQKNQTNKGATKRRDKNTNTGKENKRDNNADSENSDDDDDDDDNEPSTSKKAAGKSQSSRTKTKNAPPKASNAGKISKSYKADQSTSNKSSKQQQSKTNLESIFDELPNVPKKDNMIAAGNSSVQQMNKQINGPPTIPQFMNGQIYYNQQQQHQHLQQQSHYQQPQYQQQQRPHPALYTSNQHAPNHRYPMLTPQQQQQQQQALLQYDQSRPTQMGMQPPINLTMAQNYMTMRTQQQLVHQQQQQQQQQQQLMPNPNSLLLNNNNQKPAAATAAGQFQQSAQANAASQNITGAAKAGKKSRQRRKNKAAKSPNVDSSNKNDNSNNDDPTASTSKPAGKPNLAHSMKTKNQHPIQLSKTFKIGDIQNINNSVKTTDKIITTLADAKKPTTSTKSSTTAATKGTNVNAATSEGNTSKTLTVDGAKKETTKKVNKVVASIPPMKFDSRINAAAGGGAISKAAHVATTSTTSSTSNNPFVSDASTNPTTRASGTSNNPFVSDASTNPTTRASGTSNNPFLPGKSTNLTPSSSSVSSAVSSSGMVVNKSQMVQTSSANATPNKPYPSSGSTGRQNVLSSSSTASNRQTVSTNASTTRALSSYSSTSTATIAAASAYTSGASNPIQKSSSSSGTLSRPVATATAIITPRSSNQTLTNSTNIYPTLNHSTNAGTVSSGTNSSSAMNYNRTSSATTATAADTGYSARPSSYYYSERPVRTFNYEELYRRPHFEVPKEESKCVIA